MAPPSAAVVAAFERLMAAPLIRQMLEGIQADHARSVAETRALTEIPAPPFKEAARAAYIQRRLLALGLPDARIDAEGNVVALRKGRGQGPLLVISAHMDTVFPEGTDVTVKEIGQGRLAAPGISDNARGLAALLGWAQALQAQRVRTVGDLLFVASVGEEELGDLRGMKALFREYPHADGFLGLDGSEVALIRVRGPGSNRYEVTFKGPGGHSFQAFGLVPSAVHAMGRAISKIGDLRPPGFPKTTFTVGTVSGGAAVTAIAAEARMGVDIRSEGGAELIELDRQIKAAIDEGVAEENRRWGRGAITVTMKPTGARPAGGTPLESPVVQAVVRAAALFGQTAQLTSGGTDANWPRSLGIPSIVMGSGGRREGVHTVDEWWHPDKAYEGVQISLLTILGLVGVQDISEPLLERRKR